MTLQRNQVTFTYILKNWSKPAKYKNALIISTPNTIDNIHVIDGQKNTYDLPKLTKWLVINSGREYKQLTPTSYMIFN